LPEVTIEWLEQQAKHFIKKYWDINEMPTILLVTRQSSLTIERKLDWDNYSGYYCTDIKSIVLNNEKNRMYSLKRIKEILLHELCHWYLHITGQPYRDSDERFARELIRVGLGRKHNRDEQSVLAAKAAWKRKKREFFELIERNECETITYRIKHHRKNKDDFKRDLAKTLIRIHNQRDEDEIIYPADVAEKMCEWYGYKLEPVAVYAIELSTEWGEGHIGDKEDIALLLEKLDADPDVIENKLKDVASE
jgi:predicted SprT family Zn-dependent metalloprotease